jgi:hypothetical protein
MPEQKREVLACDSGVSAVTWELVGEDHAE